MEWFFTLQNIRKMIFLAGIGQVALSIGSLTIPRILGWQAGKKDGLFPGCVYGQGKD